VTGPDCSLADLVNKLLKLSPSEFTSARVSAILSERTVRDSSLAGFLNFRDEKYARNLVYRCDAFEMMVLCWQPGQVTPIHNHSGQCGWVRVLRGRMEETDYAAPDWMRGGVIPAGRIEIDDEGVGHGVTLTELDTRTIAAGREVSAVDRARSIHRLGNPRRHPDDERAVTLHVYARPHDSCLNFDLEAATCRQVSMRFDTTPALPLV
jgi:predicted metal-dependent enzyme (double-stranded beta helix superfamily)